MPRTLIGSTTDIRARKIASEWHGGQWSPLYALASTGSIVEGITSEISHCLRDIETRAFIALENSDKMADFISLPSSKHNAEDLEYLLSVVGPIVESWEEDQEAIEEAKVRHPAYGGHYSSEVF